MHFTKPQKMWTIGLAIVLMLTGCSSAGNKNSSAKDAGANDKKTEEVTKVGIIQYTQNDALNQNHKGFVDGLKEEGYVEGKNLKIIYQNAQADQANLQSIAQQLKGQTDLNFAISTPAAQTLLNVDKQTPALFSAVTDPVEGKLVKSMDKPGGNMTGTVDAVSAEKGVDLLLAADPKIKSIGVIYNSSEVNSGVQYQAVKSYGESRGLKVVPQTVSTTNEIQAAMTALVEKVDAVYLPTDNTVASTIPTIGQIAKEHKTPVIGTDVAHLKGSLFTYGVDYYKLGKQTAVQAGKILKGKSKPADMPVEEAKSYQLEVNEDMAKALGFDADKLKATLEKVLKEAK